MSNDMWERPQNPPEDSPDDSPADRPRRGIFARIRDWFRRPSAGHDSYVSNVTNPDDRRFIPRR